MNAPRAAALIACLAALAGAPEAAALETAQWPPPAPVETRMRELQHVIGNAESTAAQREAAREELSGLLKSPAGQARGRTADEKPSRPARAAIDPFPSVVKPNAAPLPPVGGVAHVEVIDAPKAVVTPRGGTVLAPSAPAGRFAIDPRTGSVLHEIPGGYIDPRTGRVTPR